MNQYITKLRIFYCERKINDELTLLNIQKNRLNRRFGFVLDYCRKHINEGTIEILHARANTQIEEFNVLIKQREKVLHNRLNKINNYIKQHNIQPL